MEGRYSGMVGDVFVVVVVDGEMSAVAHVDGSRRLGQPNEQRRLCDGVG